MTTWLLHGFNVSDGGDDSVARLAPFLAGDIQVHDYGWTGLIGLHCANRRAVRALLAKVKPGDRIVAHSNGCLIAWQLAEIMGADLAAVVCINPALRRDTKWRPGVPVLCLHNSTDWVVQLGRIWGRLFPLDGVAAQGWGAAGRYGFTGPARNVANWDTAMDWWIYPTRGHSGVFKRGAAGYWGGLIQAWLSHVRPQRTAASRI